MIIDGLVYLGRSHYGTELTAERAEAELTAAGADLAIAVPAHPSDRDFDAANEALLAAAAERPILVPLARVDPWSATAADGLSRAVAAGAKGLFLHPSEEHFRANDARIVRPVLDRAAELQVPVMIAAGFHLFAEPLQLGEVAGWVPGVDIVLTNGGQFNISGGSQFDVELILRLNPSLHVHTSAMYRQDFLERVVSLRGPERLLFASAAPRFTMQFERARAELAHFDDRERQLVMAGNAARIFGIER